MLSSFITENLFASIVGFILAQYLIPVTQRLAQLIKEDKGIVGKLYIKYYNSIGKRLYLAKKIDPTIINRKHEYKIHIENNIASCYCSKITDLRQDLFNTISGKIKRIGTDKNYETFFKGEINQSYLYLTESSHEDGVKNTIHSLFDLTNNPVNIIGASIEMNKRNVSTPICILSREVTMYNSLDQLLFDTPELKEKLKNIDTSTQIII